MFVKNGKNLSYLNRYFVMYLHKATVKIEEKVLGKWENAYLTAKNARASRAPRWTLDQG